jgi:hypothetical protein
MATPGFRRAKTCTDHGVMPDPVQLLDSALIRSLIERAYQSPRLWTNHNFHSCMEETRTGS